MNENNCIVLNWNAGGVNAMARWQVVREMVQDHQATAVCLKETKLNVVTESVIRETVGPALAADNMEKFAIIGL
jgi:exonuclease III